MLWSDTLFNSLKPFKSLKYQVCGSLQMVGLHGGKKIQFDVLPTLSVFESH